jgi:hypothetical protein
VLDVGRLGRFAVVGFDEPVRFAESDDLVQRFPVRSACDR